MLAMSANNPSKGDLSWSSGCPDAAGFASFALARSPNFLTASCMLMLMRASTSRILSRRSAVQFRDLFKSSVSVQTREPIHSKNTVANCTHELTNVSFAVDPCALAGKKPFLPMLLSPVKCRKLILEARAGLGSSFSKTMICLLPARTARSS